MLKRLLSLKVEVQAEQIKHEAGKFNDFRIEKNSRLLLYDKVIFSIVSGMKISDFIIRRSFITFD